MWGGGYIDKCSIMKQSTYTTSYLRKHYFVVVFLVNNETSVYDFTCIYLTPIIELNFMKYSFICKYS